MERNFSYTIQEGEHKGKTLWSGRYCCVAGFVTCFTENKELRYNTWHILAEKRSDKCPDYQGYWCLPCGFLEPSENGQQGIQREILEETGIAIPTPEFLGVETNPVFCNNGNVTLFYNVVLPKCITPKVTDECADIKWIPFADIDKYEWAFHHKEYIFNYVNNICKSSTGITTSNS